MATARETSPSSNGSARHLIGASGSGSRLDWIDASRAVCVVAVVAFHVTSWTFVDADLATVAWGPAISSWGFVNDYLATLRMPLLLAVSGLLAAGAIRSRAASAKVWIRAWTNYYLYVVWLVVYLVFYAISTDPAQPHRIEGLGAALRQLLVPETPLWYLFALAVYSAVLSAARRVPAPVVLGVLIAVSIASSVYLDGAGLAKKVPQLAIFFAGGVYGAARLKDVAERVTLPRALVAAVAVVLAVLTAKVPVPDAVNAGLFIVRGFAFLLLGITLVVVAVRWTPFRTCAVYLGRRTLPVYVIHVPLVAALLVAWQQPWADAPRAATAHPALGMVYPAITTVAVIAATLAIHQLALRVRLDFLFRLPPRLHQALTAAHPGRQPTVSSRR